MLEVARVQSVTTMQALEPRSILNGNMVNDFINYIDVSENTLKTYASGLKQFFEHLANTGIRNPVRADILNYRDALLTKGLSANTVQLYIVSIRRFFEWTNQEGLYSNIAKGIKGAKVKQNTHRRLPLEPAELVTILNNIDRDTEKGARDYAMIRLMVTTGLRTIEVSRARLSNIYANRLYIQGKGRDEADEYVKLPEATQSAINEYLRLYRNIENKEEALFTSTSNNNIGKPMTTRSISAIVKDAMRAVGIDDSKKTAHSLRHTTATQNLLNGGSVRETQQLLRHSSPNTTLVYAHDLSRMNNNSEERVNDALFKGVEWY